MFCYELQDPESRKVQKKAETDDYDAKTCNYSVKNRKEQAKHECRHRILLHEGMASDA